MTTENELTPNDITSGELWACQYRTTRMLGNDGKPVRNMALGDTARGPGLYESTGVIVTRDRRNQRLEIVDVHDQSRHVVNYADVWAIDRAVIEQDEA
jgi:hypothetical protein